MILGIALDNAGTPSAPSEPGFSSVALHCGTPVIIRLFVQPKDRLRSRSFSRERSIRRGFIRRFAPPIHSQISQIKRASRAAAVRPNQELPFTSFQP
jgi:hypothetical protein